MSISLLSLEIRLLGKLRVLLLQLNLSVLQLSLTHHQGHYQLIHYCIPNSSHFLAVLVLLISLLIVPWWTVHCTL